MDNITLEFNLPETKVLKTEKDRCGDILITVETTEDHVVCRFCKKEIYKRHGKDRERKLKHLPAFGNRKKGYRDFVTIISSRFDNKITLLAILDGRKKATIIAFLKTIPVKLIETIIAICVDMYDVYINAVKKVFNNKVMVVVDRFHVAKLYRVELDKFRQKILKQLKQELTDGQYNQIIGATKILRRRNECLTEEETKIINLLFTYSPELMETYSLAIKLTQTFNSHLSKQEAIVKFNEWIVLVNKSKLACFNKFINTLKKLPIILQIEILAHLLKV